MIPFIVAVIALAVGAGVGYAIRKSIAIRHVSSAEARAENMLTEARTKEKELLLQAKEQALKVVEQAKREEQERYRELQDRQVRLDRREATFDQKILELEGKQQQLQEKGQQLDKAKEDLQEVRKQQLEKLERIAQLSQDDAKRILTETMENQIKEDLVNRVRKLEKEGSEAFDTKAKNLLALAMQRLASSQAQEHTTTVVNLPSDDMKGRIIGKEGRNIKVLENITGVQILVDDTPGIILISGFSLLRRHMAKRVLDKLVLDGRIQPARIEETVELVKRELAKEIQQAGEEAAYECGVAGLPPKLIALLGRLKFRTSYGQNVLQHSMEVSQLAAMLAQEVGADVANCKKGGLLHDIGKSVDHEIQGTHPELGYQIMKKFGLPEEISYHSIGHHEDHPKTLEAIIVKTADALSGARTGARNSTVENYFQRLEELEAAAMSFEGVEKAYAIQAGREIRVFVTPDKIDDWGAVKMAKDIATKIEQELKYPGDVKVTVIREKRVVEYAK